MTLAELEAIRTPVQAVLDGEPVIRVDFLDHAVIRMQSQQLVKIVELAHVALSEAEEIQQTQTSEQGTNHENSTSNPGGDSNFSYQPVIRMGHPPFFVAWGAGSTATDPYNVTRGVGGYRYHCWHCDASVDTEQEILEHLQANHPGTDTNWSLTEG